MYVLFSVFGTNEGISFRSVAFGAENITVRGRGSTHPLVYAAQS